MGKKVEAAKAAYKSKAASGRASFSDTRAAWTSAADLTAGPKRKKKGKGKGKGGSKYRVKAVEDLEKKLEVKRSQSFAEDFNAMEMRVTMQKPISFYIKSAASFLKGVEAKLAEGDKKAIEAKPAVETLKISGLGEAINVAVAAAVRTEADGLGKITTIRTGYPDMADGRGCAQIKIILKKK